MEKSKQGVDQLDNGHSIEAAADMLIKNLEDIPNVKTWAEEMGYSRSYFSNKVKEHYGESPSQILINARIKYIHKKILAHPRKTSYNIAQMVGLKDDDALCHFLSNHLNTNFTELKGKLLEGQ